MGTISHRWLIGFALLPVLAIFGPALRSDRQFALRDVTHFYRPFWQFTQTQWQHGVPLWNPLEENGRPLAADPTASVFYPPQLIFWLPLDAEQAMTLYVIAHVLLGLATTAIAARWLHCSFEASLLAAVGFVFGGAVIFQYTNPIFLVGAAWLPIGVGLTYRMLATGKWRWSLWLAVVLSLMVLGGDPQMAYVLVLIGFLWIVAGQQIGEDRQAAPGDVSRSRQCGLLTGSAMTACVLLAVQLLPTIHWARQSERAYYDAPRSLVEVVSDRVAGQAQDGAGLTDVPREGTHRWAQYQFSIAAWRWPELFWPNLGGRPFPTHQRWIEVIPAEGRYWSPTLYIGLVPAMLGCLGLGFRPSSGPLRCRLSYCVVLFALACLGRYGIIWLVHEFRHLFHLPPGKGWEPVGGVYWLMSVVLPGFASFRYPAKLWTVVALALCLLSSVAADSLVANGVRRIRRWLVAYAGVTVFLLLGLLLFSSRIRAHFADVAAAVPFGPMDTRGAYVGLLWTLTHGLVVASILFWIVDRRATADRRCRAWLVIITVFDLAVAHAWLVPLTPPAEQVSLAKTRAVKSSGHTATRYLRWSNSGWYPPDWLAVSDRDRLQQVIRWDCRTLKPKYNLDQRLSAVQSSTSFSSARHRAMLDLARSAYPGNPDTFHQILSVMGVEYIVAPKHLDLSPRFDLIPLRPDAFPESTLWQNKHAFPRGWIVHETVPSDRYEGRLWSGVQAQLEQVLALGSRLKQVVVLQRNLRHPTSKPTGDAGVEYCRVIDEHAGKLKIEARLESPGYVVIRDSFDPGWSCRIESGAASSEVPVYRANQIMRCVPLPAGEHRLTMTYRPWTFTVGAWISGTCWTGLVVGLLVASSRRKRIRAVKEPLT